VVGARWRLGGLLLPGAAALVIIALAQAYSGLSNLPRWIGLGIAGTLLIVAGARVEALRREGRRAAAWVGDLR
jgi:peptidoglycan/LPS O-acetylase OafA/YrhL